MLTNIKYGRVRAHLRGQDIIEVFAETIARFLPIYELAYTTKPNYFYVQEECVYEGRETRKSMEEDNLCTKQCMRNFTNNNTNPGHEEL